MSNGDKKILVGSDHGGFALKQELLQALTAWGWEVEDAGCFEAKPVDYPDVALTVARNVAEGKSPLGLLICGSGLGMCIAANKVAGIRAVLCHDTYSAAMSRAHNNANILCCGGRVVGPELAKAVLATFLETPFEGGRHQTRLNKIVAAETKKP